MTIRSRPRSSGFIAGAMLAWCACMALLAICMSASAMRSSKTAQLDWLSDRAALAAAAGLAWAEAQASQGVCPAASTFSGSASLPGFGDMSVAVTCSLASTSAEGQSSVAEYAISSTACNAADCSAASPTGNFAKLSAAAHVWH